MALLRRGDLSVPEACFAVGCSSLGTFSTGFAVSYLGDGMSFVAVAWLAIELAPQATSGLWVGGAVAAYTLPGVVGALVFARRLRRVPARRLLLADNVVRGVFLGAVPLAWLAGLLTLPLYVVLLAVSSLLHAWGNAGKYSLLAELLPEEQRLAANTLVSSLNFAGTIAGRDRWRARDVRQLRARARPGRAHLRVPRRGRRTDAAAGVGHVSLVDQAAARGGLALLRSHPELFGLLTLTWFFNLLYGPVEVALPLHVTDDLHAPGTLLGLYWMLFGIGAVLGGLAVGALRQLPLWPVTVVIVVAWGLALLPFGFDVPTGRHRCVLHTRRRDLRTVRTALGDADAGEVATAALGRDARSPQRGAARAHRAPARYRTRRTAHHGAGPARDARRLRTRHGAGPARDARRLRTRPRCARRHRVRPAAGPTKEPVSA